MIKKIFFLAIFFSGLCFLSFTTKAKYLDNETSVNNSFSAGSSSYYDIIINEIYANPVGAEDAAMPNGEWVELYNKGDWPIDISGWHLYDAIDSHDLPITTANVSGGLTLVPAKGYIVVYRNGDSDFSLNNSGTETVRLFNGLLGVGNLINSRTYIDTIESKSWAGVPNGTGVWSDNHIPTPGLANI